MGASQGKVELAEQFAALQREPKPSTDPFWDSLLGCTFTVQDMYAVLSPESVRSLLTAQPTNLRIVLNVTTGLCRNYVLTERQPTAAELQTVTNSVHILSRFLPFVLESKSSVVAELIWKPPAVESAASSDPYDGLCLAQKIMRTVFEILFRPDFCIGPRAEMPPEQIICIEGLVTVGGPMPSQPSMDDRCTGALRVLLACFSETLYTPAAEFDSTTNQWLQWATSPSNSMAVPALSALLNLALNYDPVGWGLPYNYLVSPDDSHDQLVCTALHVLILLLDYKPSRLPAKVDDIPAPSNSFVDSLGAVDSKQDFEKMYDGFIRLLSNPNQATQTYLPNSMKEITCQEELLVLLWKCFEANPKFLKFAKTRRPSGLNPFTQAACFYICTHMDNPSKSSLVHICVFILLLFSGEREFSVQLNDTMTGRLPASIVTAGTDANLTVADLLVLTLHKLMIHGGQSFSSLHICCLTVVANITSYVKTWSHSATSRLLDLLSSTVSPVVVVATKFAAGSETAATVYSAFQSQTELILLLFDVLNNVLQYQSESNARLTYGIVRQRDLIASLSRAHDAVLQLVPSNGTTANDESEGRLEGKDAVALGEWTDQIARKSAVVLKLASDLLPVIEAYCAECAAAEDVAGEDQVVEFLEKYTLVGLLPVPHPILIRKYQPNSYTGIWFTTYIWSVIYLQQQDPPLFDANTIKLFAVHFDNSPEQKENS